MSTGDVYAESAGQRYKLETLSGFRMFREFALSEEAWSRQYSDAVTTVESRPPEDASTGLNIVRVRREMKDIPAIDLYDNLHDAQYREVWDESMLEGYNIVKLNPHNDIGYYAAKFPWPLKNRDFCNLRSWMEFTNGEYIIFNHSVPHNDCPVRKGFIRAKSILTGYLIQPLGSNGCVLVYITQSDPCGSIPHSIINFTTTRLVPRVLNKLESSTREYPEYVRKNHTVPREEQSWRTPKMDWNSLYNFPAEELDSKKNAAVPSAENRNDDNSLNINDEPPTLTSKNTNAALITTTTTTATTNGPPRQVSPRVSFVSPGLATTEVLSLAPVAPNCSDDTIAIQQYRALMQEAMNTADRTFLQDGRTPELTQYLTRLAYIIDGIRQTTAH